MSSPADSPFSYYQDFSPPTPPEFQYESAIATPPEFQYELALATPPESQNESLPSLLPSWIPSNVTDPVSPLGKRRVVIAGCVIGFILLVLALWIFIVCYRRKRSKRHDVVEIFHGEPPHEPKGMSAFCYIYIVLNYQSSLHLTRI
ncbi:hypothetical protein GBA52_009791 [Prunus armeniaca]|nr:hypothetical protein GBA52_009791 [Prunus armeniaca]